jgi:hypothetical protein
MQHPVYHPGHRPTGSGRRSGRATAALLALLGPALLSGCQTSHLDTAAKVNLTGSLAGPDGRPLGGQHVVLLKEADLGELLGGGVAIVATLGIACATSAPPAICRGTHATATGPDGGFRLGLTGSDTQGTFGQASTFDLTATLAPAAGEAEGASVTDSFDFQVADLALPQLRVWHPQLSVATSGGRLRVGWSALPGSGYGPNPAYTVRFTAPGGAQVWSAGGQPAGVDVDPRVLEDSRGSVLVEARTEGAAQGTPVTTFERSQQLAYQGSAGPPPSRGRPCFVQTAAGETLALTPCSLTDGDLRPGRGLHAPAPGVHTAAYVALGGVRPVSLVVVRGCVGICTVETSNDAQTWTSLGTGQGAAFALSGPPSLRAADVRVRSAVSLDTGLDQISVW